MTSSPPSPKTKTTRRLFGYKEIAEYLADEFNVLVSVRTLQRWAAAEIDPLPVEVFGGRISILASVLDVWVEGQFKRRC